MNNSLHGREKPTRCFRGWQNIMLAISEAPAEFGRLCSKPEAETGKGSFLAAFSPGKALNHFCQPQEKSFWHYSFTRAPAQFGRLCLQPEAEAGKSSLVSPAKALNHVCQPRKSFWQLPCQVSLEGSG